MRVSYDVKLDGSEGFGLQANIFDQVASDTFAPMSWLNKERIQLAVSIWAMNNGREPLDGTVCFCDEDMATFDVLQGKCNSFWMRQERFTVARIVG